jgi:hypothetical protein
MLWLILVTPAGNIGSCRCGIRAFLLPRFPFAILFGSFRFHQTAPDFSAQIRRSVVRLSHFGQDRWADAAFP